MPTRRWRSACSTASQPDPRAAALELAAGFTQLDADAVARVKAVVRTASNVLDALEQERVGNLEAWSGAVGRR